MDSITVATVSAPVLSRPAAENGAGDSMTSAHVGPSDTLKADLYWLQYFEAGVIDLEEAERRARGSLRLRDAYSPDSWYASKAERDPMFWSKFYASRVNW